ncbi:MAG: ketopantoate reductase family protein [Alphaproteobacteria bacterium GM202ARS2]|nr:ketopantoate reductase family protein [Alphaproteobacteria bacterium GM202ARS2]
MRIAIIGGGGIGGYLAAMLAQKEQDVTLIARGSHLLAMTRKGLHLKRQDPLCDIRPRLKLTAMPAKLDAEVVLVCVKMTDLESVAQQLSTILTARSLILPVQNGVEAHAILSQHLPEHDVGKGTAHISARIVEPGVVTLDGRLARFFFSAPTQTANGGETLAAFARIAEKADVTVSIEKDDSMERLLWHKFIFLTAFSGLTTALRVPLGVIRAHPSGLSLFYQAMCETESVAKAQGKTFPQSPSEQWRERLASMPESYRASMSLDAERNKPLELPWLSAAVVRMGEAHSIETPVHTFITTMLTLPRA